MKKLLLSFVFVLLIVAVGVATTLGWDNTTAIAEVNSPYTVNYIETEADFLDFIKTGRYTGNTYILTSDIYLDRLYAEGGKLGTTAGGGDLLAFTGTFDGRGHAIVGLKEPLFDTIGEDGVVEDLLLIGVEGKEGSTLSTNPKYALAYLNKGTIKDVHMTGEVEYSAFVGTNSGTIEHSLAVIKRANMVEGKETMLFAYENTGTIDDQYSYAYDVNNDKEWGKRSYFIGADSIDYVVINQALACDESLILRYGVNLFNTPFVVPETMNNATISNKLAGYINTTFTICYYNADYLPYEIDVNYYLFDSNVVIHNTLGTFSGDGTKENPYEIGTIDDLMTLSILQEGEYAMLVEDIILDEVYLYGDNKYLIEELNGHFDGNGHTITMGNFKNQSDRNVKLFNTISATGTVTDLFMSGYLADYNYGTISNVTGISVIGFEYADNYIAFISSNEGTIIRSHAEGFAGLVGNNTLTGQMIYCSSKNNLFVLNNNGTIYGGYYEMTEEKSAFSILFDGRTFILPNAKECVGVNKLDIIHVYAYTSDIDLDNFPSISTKNNEYLYTEAWAFGLETESDEEVYSWGYINNNFADLPILVKPENRLDYKQNLRFQEGYVESKEYAYGKNNGRGEYVLETIPAGSDTTSYTPFDDGTSNLFVGANGHVYELLTTLNGSFTVESAEYIITSRLSADCKEHLSGKDFEWKYRAIGGEEYAPYEGTTFDPATNPATEYYLSYKDEYVYLEALVTLGDKLNIEYTYVELGVGLKTIISTLGLRNDLSNLFNELGYTEGVSTILGYYEPTLRIYLDEEEITLEDLLKVERGNSYKVTVTFPSTNTVSGTTLSANFTITEGTIDTSKYQIESTIGGASELDAIVYDGESIDLDGVFSLKNFGLAQITAWEIVELERIDGNIYVGIDSVKDAGVYTLSITISVDGFQDVTRNILFYVARKEIDVFVKVGGVEDEVTLNYYDALPTVSYHAEDGTNLDELKELSYLSTYSQGSKVTTGAEFYTLSFLAPTNEYLNMNYIINAVDSLVKIKVNPVKITTIGAVFPSLEEIYNGEEYALTFNESYILKNTLDPNPLDYTMCFEYEDESQATQFAFTDAGIYTIKAKVVSNTPNYLDSDMVEATLTIKKNKTTVKAFDTYVNYGEDAEYSILVTHTEYPSKINLRKVLMEGTHYTVNSSYVKGETKAGENVEFSISPLAYDDSLAGVLINYDITWDDTTAILTIGKKNYELDMVDSYEYTGKGVELDFNGEEFTFSEGYPIYKKLSSGVETDFVGVPANVCDGTFLYVVYFKVEETDEYYGTDVVRKEFSITKRMIDVSGLYVFHGEQKTPLSDNLTFIYDKSEYRIDIDRNEFNGGGDIVFTYTYKLFDDSEEYTIHTPIMLTDVVRIKEISLSITGDNYENWTSDLDISSFTIAPREVALDNDKLSPLQYKGYEYDIDFMTERVNALPFLSGYAPIEGDQVAFSVALKENGRIIRDPGAYTLVVTSLNPNYVYATSDTYTLTQGVNSGRAYVNLENYDFGEFEYSTVRINAPYIIAKDFEFIIDDTETLKADVKFFINYNSAMQTDLNGALAPGTYSITSAESITGDVNGEITEFIAFEVKNGVDKVKIKPLAITFNYLNMTSGAVGGIKPSYVYGDPDLSSLPNYVARAMTRALSGIDYTEVPDIRITCDKDTIKHAGTYTFTATANKQTINDEGVLVDCFTLAEEVRSYTMKVEKREITVELTPVQIYVGENAPITYKVNYPLSTSEPIGNEKLSLTYSFSVHGFDNTIEGDYAVTIDEVKLNEGGEYYYDYVPVKLNPSAKELSVRFMEFDSSLTAQGLSTVYTGYPVYPTVSGVPDDAVVSYSITPINVGNHSVTVTVSKHKYRTKTFECAVNITPATPTIVFDGANSFPFDVRHELSHSDVNAYAHLNGVRVEGTFYFMQTDGLVETEYLRYGKYTYRVGFNPTSSNFTSVAGLSYEMTTYLEEDDYAITINDGPVVESITSTENVTLKLVTSERVGSSMIMLVDGNNSYNQYVFEESASNVLIDLRIRNVSVYSVIINVVIQEETPDVPSGEDPLPPEEDDNLSSGENEGGTNMGGNNSGSGNMTPEEEEQTKDEGSNLGLIIGLSVGGGVLVIAGVVVAVVLILKKKRD